MANLENRNFLTLLDFSAKEIKYLLELSSRLKKDKHSGIEQKNLEGKNIALIFEKASTRTRCSFEVASLDQGAHTTYRGKAGGKLAENTRLSKKNSPIYAFFKSYL